ncbi:MAG: sugar ABC transporter substrate-binding protein [Clostridia bacterium]|nr:sugar ABC transporter substrate-binding protein [Clostridia bacterium]
MKKLLAILLATMLVLAMAGSAMAEGGTRKVFFTNAFYTAPFCDPLNNAATAYAQENGVELTIVDGQGDASVQLDQIKTAIDQGYDGIIYFPADAEGSITIVNTLNESGIPYAIIDSRVDASVADTIYGFAGPDNIQMGEAGGQACVDLLGEEGGKVVCMMGAAGTDPATNRQQGFVNIVSQHDNIEIIYAENVEGWDTAIAMSQMQDVITRFGDDYDFIWCHDDGIYQGVHQALEAAGIDEAESGIISVGTGCNAAGVAGIRGGYHYGDVLHSAKEEGQLGVQLCIDAMDGKVKPGDAVWYKCSSPLVTIENVDEFDGIGW